jgi:large subunit ribosomal protein L6
MTKFGEKNKSNNLWGLSRTLIANAVEGVTNGYSKVLEIIGIGYKVEQQGSNLKFNLGYNNLIEFPVPEGISIEIKDGAEITVSGIDKQLVGETAASIRRLRPPEPYKGKGIRYKDEYVKIKVGKSAA